MAKTHSFKLYINDEYVASVKHPMYAAMILAATESGQIRYGHRHIVYTEGVDGKSSESYDNVCEIVANRLHKVHSY